MNHAWVVHRNTRPIRLRRGWGSVTGGASQPPLDAPDRVPEQRARSQTDETLQQGSGLVAAALASQQQAQVQQGVHLVRVQVQGLPEVPLGLTLVAPLNGEKPEVMVGQAEIKGEKILDAAHRRAAELAEDIREMKQFKRRLAVAIRSAIQTHLGLLEGLAADPPNDPALDGKVASLSPAPKEIRARKP